MDQKGSEQSAKKVYATPQLVEYGNIAKLTAKSGSRPDGKSGMIMTQQCL
jgi:hypothetical protein